MTIFLRLRRRIRSDARTSVNFRNYFAERRSHFVSHPTYRIRSTPSLVFGYSFAASLFFQTCSTCSKKFRLVFSGYVAEYVSDARRERQFSNIFGSFVPHPHFISHPRPRFVSTPRTSQHLPLGVVGITRPRQSVILSDWQLTEFHSLGTCAECIMTSAEQCASRIGPRFGSSSEYGIVAQTNTHGLNPTILHRFRSIIFNWNAYVRCTYH